jgi:class 3 adenylate cyclase/pimeloyl-ACP methyl ester carboxylesterase
VQAPEIRYARSGDVSIAYYVVGEGPRDLLFVHGFVGNLEGDFEEPTILAFNERLASFARLIKVDRRGTGLSDRVREVPTLETRMDDVRAVLDAVGSQHAILFGTFEGASICMLFAATYPERTSGLVLYSPIARGTWSPEYPWAMTPDKWRAYIADIADRWGTPELVEEDVRRGIPSRIDDAAFKRRLLSRQRSGASPSAVRAVLRMRMDVDVVDVLPTIRAPTLVITGPPQREEAKFIAERIPKARVIEAPGPDFYVWMLGDLVYDEVERFVRGLGVETEPETVLATVLFTDIVDSTLRAAELGDHAWGELLSRHHAIVRRHLGQFRGTEIDTAGDGFFASFDVPVRAIRCARAICESVKALGLEVRAGVHAGECELVAGKLGGLAVVIGARVAAHAKGGEVLVSGTVKDLVAGSRLEFDDRGTHELQGVPGEWKIHAVR